MFGRSMISTVFFAVLLWGCDSTTGPDPSADEVLAGAVQALSEVGEVVSPVGATVIVQNTLGEIFAVPVAGDGSWTATDLGPGPYVVRAEAPGFSGIALDVAGGTTGAVVRLVERSTARVLRVNEARVIEACGASPCLDLSFTVAESGIFPPDLGRRIFRVFVADSDDVSPENHRESMAVIITDDDPLLDRNGAEVTVNLEALRGFDLSGLPTGLFVYVAGATENSVVGPLAETMAEFGFPDLAETGASARATN